MSDNYMRQAVKPEGCHEGMLFTPPKITEPVEKNSFPVVKTIEFSTVRAMLEQVVRAPHTVGVIREFLAEGWQNGWRIPFEPGEYDFLIYQANRWQQGNRVQEAAGRFLTSCVTGHRYDDYLRQPPQGVIIDS